MARRSFFFVCAERAVAVAPNRKLRRLVGMSIGLSTTISDISDIESRRTLFRAQFLDSELVSRCQRLGRGNLHVGLDTRSFPVGFGDLIDRPRGRNADDEVIIDPLASDRMRSATSRLPNNRGALQILQIVTELLGAGERSL